MFHVKQLALILFIMAFAGLLSASFLGVESSVALDLDTARPNFAGGIFLDAGSVGLIINHADSSTVAGIYHGKVLDIGLSKKYVKAGYETQDFGLRIRSNVGVGYLPRRERLCLYTGTDIGVYYRWLVIFAGRKDYLARWKSEDINTGAWTIGIGIEKGFVWP